MASVHVLHENDAWTAPLEVELDFGLGEIFGIILMPLVVAAFLIWYSKRTESKGWIS